MKIINFIIKNYKSIFIASFFIILMLLLNQCNSTKNLKNKLKAEEKRTEQNIAALNADLESYKNKDSIPTYSKPIAQMSKEELEKYFPGLYEKIKAETGEVKYITNTEVVYRDTGSVKNTVSKLDKDYYSVKSEFYNPDSSVYLKNSSAFYAKVQFLDTSKSKFKLNITSDVTTYEEMRFKFGLTTGIKKDEKGIYKIFVTPDNDKFTVTSLKGADVSNYFKQPEDALKQAKKWSIGPSIGYGIVFGKNNQIYHGPTVGFHISYSLMRF